MIPCPKISLVLPTYNHGKYLSGAIESILNQEYVDVQIIVVNDGSTDETSQVLKRYRNRDNIIIIEQPNLGLPAALNVGFSEATAELVTWTSADNLMSPFALATLAENLIKNPKTVLVYGDYALIKENGIRCRNSNYRLRDQDFLDTSIIHNCRTTSLFDNTPDNFIGPYFLFRKQGLQRIGKYRDLLGVEDYDYWLRLNQVGDFLHTNTAEPQYYYRIHDNSLSARKKYIGTIGKLRELVKEYEAK